VLRDPALPARDLLQGERQRQQQQRARLSDDTPPSPARLSLRRRGPRQLALGCGKYDGYEPGPTAAPTAPQHWDAASSSYVDASGASGVGELSTVVCADKKGVAYAWEANMRGERDGAAGVPVALYGCLNRACCVSLGSVLGEWRCRARARFRARGAGGRG
jgi:hypothetical protein